jgi:hypothetical protein
MKSQPGSRRSAIIELLLSGNHSLTEIDKIIHGQFSQHPANKNRQAVRGTIYDLTRTKKSHSQREQADGTILLTPIVGAISRQNKKPHTHSKKAKRPVVNVKNNSMNFLPFETDSAFVDFLKFQDVDQIIHQYLQESTLAEKSPMEILDHSVDSTIYRFFRNEDIRPSEKFRGWTWFQRGDDIINFLNGVFSQSDFDAFALYLGRSLNTEWGKSERMSHGVAMKIINLILKHFAFSDHVINPKALPLLHVPWDLFTLQPLRIIFRETATRSGIPQIPAKRGMGYVESIEIYNALHTFITDICDRAGVLRVHYELIAWDKGHQ